MARRVTLPKRPGVAGTAKGKGLILRGAQLVFAPSGRRRIGFSDFRRGRSSGMTAPQSLRHLRTSGVAGAAQAAMKRGRAGRSQYKTRGGSGNRRRDRKGRFA